MSVAGDTRGKTLPARAYTSPEVYEAEMREVFLKSWNFACHVSDVAEPGKFWTTTIAGEPIAVLRDKDGQLRALSNVCRHRAARILDGQGSCPKVLRCPYHGWTYRQDGQLAAVPEARGFDNLDRESVRLPAFRVGELSGMVFVCMSEEAEPLDTYFGDLAEKLAPLRLAELGAGPRLGNGYDHNWKVITDNYLEGYHIPVGHPGLLRLLDYKRYVATPAKNHTWIDGPFRNKPSRNYQERLYQKLLRPMKDFPRGPAGGVDVRAPVAGHVHRHLPRSDRHLAAVPRRAAAHQDRGPGLPLGLGRDPRPAGAGHQLARQHQGDGRGRGAVRHGAAGPRVAHL